MEVPVSFNRFESGLLSSEKPSSFPPNSYLDEAGSLSTPGSVAEKKAYFEAHYKKTAHEESDQAMHVKPATLTLDESSNGVYAENSAEFGLYGGRKSVDGAENGDDFDCNGGDDDNVAEFERPLVEEAKDESNISRDELKKDSPSRKNEAKQPNPKSNSDCVAQEVTSSEKGMSSTPMKRETSLDLQSSSPMIRKPLMMEKMGDKDIVKRAFETFQNRVYASCNDERPNTPKEVKSAASEAKISTPTPRKKGKEGVTNAVGNIHTRTIHYGNRSNGRNVSSNISLGSNERTGKRLQRQNPLPEQQKSLDFAAESKEEKESEIRELRKSLNFKAKPLPSFYKDQTKSKVKIIGVEIYYSKHRPLNSNMIFYDIFV